MHLSWAWTSSVVVLFLYPRLRYNQFISGIHSGLIPILLNRSKFTIVIWEPVSTRNGSLWELVLCSTGNTSHISTITQVPPYCAAMWSSRGPLDPKGLSQVEFGQRGNSFLVACLLEAPCLVSI